MARSSPTLNTPVLSFFLSFVHGSRNRMLIKLFAILLSVAFPLFLPTSGMPEGPVFGDRVLPKGKGGEKCNLFSGKWIPNSSPPPYTNRSCTFMHDRQNCMKNGRPDMGYLHWRWKPSNCELPPFGSKKFLNAMRNKSWALIGDSILRNQMQSLICLLSEVEKPIDIYHDKSFHSRTWHFTSHNFTLSTIWAPFLLKADFLSKIKVNLYLDTLETKWTTRYHNHDYIVISAGSWFGLSSFMWENHTVVGCHACQGKFQELGMFYPYRRALQSAFKFITSSDHKPLVIFRTWSPNHFKYGEWFSGGVCNRTAPYREGEYNGTPIDRGMYAINSEEFEKAAAIGSERGIRMRALDVYRLSLMRPDGHPGAYMWFHPFEKGKSAKVQNDCLHWCLPGPVDTWNELMMEMLMNEDDLRNASS